MESIGKKLHKKDMRLHAFLETHNEIYLYGAGRAAEELIYYLKEEGRNISGIIVTDKTDNDDFFYDIKIYGLGDIVVTQETGIIMGVKASSQPEILQILKSAGIYEEHIFPQRLYFQNILPGFNKHTTGQQNNTDTSYFKEYTSLDQIGQKFNTDKCSRYHNYLNKYEFFLKKWKNEPVVLLELGIFRAASLYSWNEYFKNGMVYGVDIDKECERYDTDSCKVIIKNLAYEDDLDELGKLQPNIIIDDASHRWSHQIKALYHLFPALSPGGVYILEDLGTSFESYKYEGYDDAVISAYDFLAAVSEYVCSREKLAIDKQKPGLLAFIDEIEMLAEQIELISFIHESCIIVKH